MVREFPVADRTGRFVGISRNTSRLFAAMLPVHFDLFLYVIRKTYNRLFLREFKAGVRLFLTLQWNQGGEGVLSGQFGLWRTKEPVQVRGMLRLLRAKSPEGTGRYHEKNLFPGYMGRSFLF
jgi:hypothetical protein